MSNRILFSETQRFRQWWLWIILIGVNGLFIVSLIQEFVLKTPEPGQGMNTALILSGIIPLIITVFFLNIKLETEVKEDGIYVRLFPLHLKYKFFAWSDIASAEVRTYKPIKEYGGWGLRGMGKNMAYNVSGDQGLQLVLKTGHRLLIGTRQPEAIDNILKKIFS